MNAPRSLTDAVVRNPRDFECGRDDSSQALLMASGYDHEHAAVDVPLIEEALREHPEFVREWLEHSENKRSRAGWFIRMAGSGGWEVGYAERGAIEQVSFYHDRVAACAVFVKKEIDAVRASAS